jgi:pilus assembly protein HofN
MFAVIFCLRINQLVRLHALQTELTGMQSVQHALSRQKLPHRRRSLRRNVNDAHGNRCWNHFPAPSFTGLADRAALSASCSDADRVCHTLPALSALRDALGK